MINGTLTYLRPPLQADVPVMTVWENQPEIQAVSEHSGSYTQEEVHAFFLSAGDLFADGQQRFIICRRDTHDVIGAVDLFSFNRSNASAGIGILISPAHLRGQGYASDAIKTMLTFGNNTLGIRTMRCIIYPENAGSIRLFERNGFKAVGMEFFKNKKAVRYECQLRT
jgi:diamine N-acetyltransferase